MSIIIEDGGIPQSRILSCGGFRDLGCLQRLCRLVSFKRPVYEKVVETFRHLAEQY
jgi:hypothetical protein